MPTVSARYAQSRQRIVGIVVLEKRTFSEEGMQQREIELIESTITNGRIYFPSTDAKFFPADSFSDRASDGHKGKDVEFFANDYRFTGPIRISSGQRLSPQRSFAPFLKSVAARAGDRLVVVRRSEREYEVTYKRVVE